MAAAIAVRLTWLAKPRELDACGSVEVWGVRGGGAERQNAAAGRNTHSPPQRGQSRPSRGAPRAAALSDSQDRSFTGAPGGSGELQILSPQNLPAGHLPFASFGPRQVFQVPVATSGVHQSSLIALQVGGRALHTAGHTARRAGLPPLPGSLRACVVHLVPNCPSGLLACMLVCRQRSCSSGRGLQVCRPARAALSGCARLPPALTFHRRPDYATMHACRGCTVATVMWQDLAASSSWQALFRGPLIPIAVVTGGSASAERHQGATACQFAMHAAWPA